MKTRRQAFPWSCNGLHNLPFLSDAILFPAGRQRTRRCGAKRKADLIFIKQIHTFTSNILFKQRRFGQGCPSCPWVATPGLPQLGCPSLYLVKKQYVAGERVDLLDDFVFPARTNTETGLICLMCQVSSCMDQGGLHHAPGYRRN